MITLSGFIEEDFVNYKKPSMVLGFPKCSFKCGEWCQNYNRKKSKRINITIKDIISRFLTNSITEAIVFAGLEPFDSFPEMVKIIEKFREVTNSDIVIYTGYEYPEISEKIALLRRNYRNIIVKFGRYIPNQ